MNDASEIEGKSGAVYLAKNFANQKGWTSVTSTLCYSSQWEAMCRCIEDSQRTPRGKTKPELTGSAAGDISKNIYDLAGNCQEWTMEGSSADFCRIRRGGNYSDTYTISDRMSGSPGRTDDGTDFHPTFYIK